MTDPDKQHPENPEQAEQNDDFEDMLKNALGPSEFFDSRKKLADIDASSDVLVQPVPEGHKSGFVAVIGRPNVGKSTLMNAIIGEKIAIVSPKPQTTRIQQLGIYSTDMLQIVFVDTPGIHKPRTNLGHFMVDMAVNALRDADVVLFLTDLSEPLSRRDHNVADIIKEAGHGVTVIRVLNKVDEHKDPESLQIDVDKHLALVPYAEWTTTVATRGDGVEKLVETIASYLPEGPRFYPPDQVSDMQVRDMVAELVREAVLHSTRDEVPHSVATLIQDFKERENGVAYIACEIYVERDTQKKIIIGKDGEMIKRISTRARKEAEEMLQQKVYLELRVKVMKNWRSDQMMLQRLGYRLGQS